MSMIKLGARVRQKPRIIEGLITKREIIGEGITYFVHDEATAHEIPIAGEELEVLAEPVEEAAPEVHTEDPAA